VGDSAVVILAASSPATMEFRLTIVYHSAEGAGRKLVKVDAPPPWPSTVAKIVRLAPGVVVDAIGVEELSIFNSGGLSQ
jgi:hypothetical protein